MDGRSILGHVSPAFAAVQLRQVRISSSLLLSCAIFSLCFAPLASAQIEIPVTPIITVDPPVLDFGSVQIGQVIEGTLNIRNEIPPPSQLVITALSAIGPVFSILEAPPLPATIPGPGVPVDILFRPTAVGPANGLFEIVGNASNSPMLVRLTGIGVLANVPSAIPRAWEFVTASLSFAPRDTFEVASVEGATTITEDNEKAGLPSLPVLTAQLLLPRDRRIREVIYQAVSQPQVGHHLLYPIQREGTLDGEPQPEFVPPDPAVYSSPVPYPSRLVEVVNETWYRGYRLATIEIHPLQYVGASSTVILNTQITATFLLEPMSGDELAQMAPKLRPDYKASYKRWVEKEVARRVVNPEALATFYGEPQEAVGEAPQIQVSRAWGGFTPSEMPSLDSPPVEYVIVTSDALADTFKVLADWKTSSGMPAVIRTVDWIDGRYPGLDPQERIRNFIRDAYSKWGTNYVLLGGDTEVVPDRFFYPPGSYTSSFANPPVDYYYAALDGNWNSDGNSDFEPGPDRSHEVMVARAPVNTPVEAGTFVDKVMSYARAPGRHAIDGNYYNSLLLLGGSTWYWSPGDLNGIWVAETIENAVETRASQTGGDSVAVRRLYENAFFGDSLGPCRSTSGDTCQSRVGFRSLSTQGQDSLRVKIEICSGNFQADRFELSVAASSGVTLGHIETFGPGLQWTFSSGESTSLRLVWRRSGPMPPNTCEAGSASIRFWAKKGGLRRESDVQVTERMYNGAVLVHGPETEPTLSDCASSQFELLRDFLCSGPDSNEVFTQSRQNEFNANGMLTALNQGYGFVFHHEHSFVDRLGGPTNANHLGPWCARAHHPGGEKALIRGVVPDIDSGYEYGIFYSHGSYQNAVDKDAVSEALMRVPRGGAVAYLAKQRSAGVNVNLAKALFVNCFDPENFGDLGSAAYSAMETGQSPDPVGNLLLGDPAMPIFNRYPQTLALAGSGLGPITSLGRKALEYRVSIAGSAVPGALVCVTQDSTAGSIGNLLYKFGETDASGVARLGVDIQNEADLRVVVTARNADPHVTGVPVTADATPDVFYADHELLGTLGDSEGRAKAGYSGTLRVRVENRGGGQASNVTATLVPRGAVTFKLLIDLPSDVPDQGSIALPQRVFIGPGLRTPPTIPFTFEQLAIAGIEPEGTPSIPASQWGYFVWRFAGKWYVVWKGSQGSELFEGEIRSSGGFATIEEIEPFETITNDALSCESGQCESGDRVVSFRTMTSIGDEDGIRLDASDMRNVLVTGNATQSFGNIPAGDPAVADYMIDIMPDAEDRHEALMELQGMQVDPPLSLGLFTVPLTAPKLEVVSQNSLRVVDDTFLRIRVRNRGTAQADYVTVKIASEQAANVLTGTEVLGVLQAGVEKTTQLLKIKADNPGYPATTRLRVTLENQYPAGGTVSWTQTGVDILKPPAIAEVKALPATGGVRLSWPTLDRVPPVDTTAAAGYNIYRLENETFFPRVNDSLVVGTTLFFDSFDFDSFSYGLGLVPNRAYTYAVVAVDSSWNESERETVSVTTSIAELSGWPKQIDVGTEGSVVVADVVADIDGGPEGDLEILHAGRAIYAWHHNGQEVRDGDSDSSTDGVFFNEFALEDTDLQAGRRFMNDLAVAEGELIVATSWDGWAYFLNPFTGQLVDGQCKPCVLQGGAGFASPIVANIKVDDPHLEIVVSTENGWLQRWIFDDGTRTIRNQGSIRVHNGSSNWGGPAVGNIDNDASLEIVYATRDGVFALDWPIVTVEGLLQLWHYGFGGDVFSSTPTLANLDGDAKMEVVVAFHPSGSATSRLVAIDDNGIPLSGWPVDVSHVIGDGSRLPSPAVANILGGPSPEIIVGDGYGGTTVNVSVFDVAGDSAASWHLEYLRNYVAGEAGVRSSISVADADGDGQVDVLHGTDLHHVVVWNPVEGDIVTGTPKPGWPIVMRESVRGRVTVADLDQGGTLELVASDLAGVIHVLDFPGGLKEISVPEGSAPVHDRLGWNHPNPFNPRTTIPFEVSRRGLVSLRIYHPTGRLVREIVSEVRDPGSYEEIWDGRDEAGRILPSGVYLSEFRVDRKTVGSRKVLLVR